MFSCSGSKCLSAFLCLRQTIYVCLQGELLSLKKCYVEEGLDLLWTFQQIDLGLMDDIESGQIVVKHKMSLLKKKKKKELADN